jgi:hypothetical protein
VIIIAKKKPIIKEIKEELPKQEKERITEVDCFVPCHFVDWGFFRSNIQAMLNEIPIRKLYVGCNNPKEEYLDDLRSFLSKHEKIEFVDQRGIKTLGMQIVDLMKRCTTEFFVFCHADAKPRRHSFLVLEADMLIPDPNDKRKAGIIESDRVQFDYTNPKKFPDQYPHYYYRDRSFSGYQLFRREAVEHFFDKIEDDYIYRNEDIIWQNVCEANGYRYVKSSGMHVHTCSVVNHQWTPQGVELTQKEARALTFDMQVKGLVKYCEPTELAVNAWRDAIGICISENGLDLWEFIDGYITETNPEWVTHIKKTLVDLLKYFVWR